MLRRIPKTLLRYLQVGNHAGYNHENNRWNYGAYGWKRMMTHYFETVDVTTDDAAAMHDHLMRWFLKSGLEIWKSVAHLGRLDAIIPYTRLIRSTHGWYDVAHIASSLRHYALAFTIISHFPNERLTGRDLHALLEGVPACDLSLFIQHMKCMTPHAKFVFLEYLLESAMTDPDAMLLDHIVTNFTPKQLNFDAPPGPSEPLRKHPRYRENLEFLYQAGFLTRQTLDIWLREPDPHCRGPYIHIPNSMIRYTV